MKKRHIHALLAALIVVPAPTTKTAYSNIKPAKLGVILTPASISNGQLGAVSSPQLAGYLEKAFNGLGYTIFNSLTVINQKETSALQSDGKILVAGGYVAGQSRYMVTRFNTNGSVDTSFNLIGAYNSPPGSLLLPTFNGSTADTAFAIAVQPNGKIIVAGKSLLGAQHCSVARLTSDGALDTTFNSTDPVPGTFVLPIFTGSSDNYVEDIAIQQDGKIILGGTSYIGGVGGAHRYSVARLNPNGSLDSTFNQNDPIPGTYMLPAFTGSTINEATSCQLQINGKIILAGLSNVGGSKFSLAQLETNGSLDTTFNPTSALPGTFILPSFTESIANGAADCLIQPDGKIVLVGNSFIGGAVFHFSAARITPNGSLDTTFNSTGPLPGTYVLPTFTNSTQDLASSCTLQPDGKIVIGGFSTVAQAKYSVARLNPDGSLDNSFGPTENGFYILPTFQGSAQDIGKSIALESNGTIILAGQTQLGANPHFSLASLSNNYTLAVYQAQYPEEGGFY